MSCEIKCQFLGQIRGRLGFNGWGVSDGLFFGSFGVDEKGFNEEGLRQQKSPAREELCPVPRCGSESGNHNQSTLIVLIHCLAQSTDLGNSPPGDEVIQETGPVLRQTTERLSQSGVCKIQRQGQAY